MHRYSSALFGSLAVICAYVLVRGWVYHLFPVASLEAWFVRDTLMSIPRLAAFFALLGLNRVWNVSYFEMPLRDVSRAAYMGFVPTVLWVLYFSAGHGKAFTPLMMIVGIFTSLIVGVFEEYAFRGPLLSALRHHFSLFTSILLGNLLFTIYHVQAQPIRGWAIIFLTGVIFTNFRIRGLSLGGLALIHGVTDAFYFVSASISPDPFGLYGLGLHTGLLIYAVLTFPRSTTEMATCYGRVDQPATNVSVRTSVDP